MIVCVNQIPAWVTRLARVLLLEPFRQLHGDPWGFDNAEFAIGSGFLAVVAPASDDSQLGRFLDRYGEGLYAISLSVDSLDAAMTELAAAGVASHVSSREGMFRFGWIHPSASGGPLYQLTEPITRGFGGNANLSVMNRAAILVDEINAASWFPSAALGLTPTSQFVDELYGCQAADLIIEGSDGDAIRLVEKCQQTHVRADHPAILGFTLTAHDLDQEVARLADLGIAVSKMNRTTGRRALIDPAAMGGLHVELEQKERK